MYQVIIVEDDPMVAEIDKQYVEHNSKMAIAGIFQNGQEALDFVRTHPVDLIMLDYYMPVMDGRTFLVKLRAEGILADVIMVTAASEARHVSELYSYGVSDYLMPDHDRISLTTEPVQALSIVRVAHCWKRCPRLPLPRLQDPLRPGQIRGSCAEDRTCLAITHCFRIHHGLADAAHGPTLRASFGEERKTKHPRARPAHQRAQLGA